MKILQVIPYFNWSYGGPVKVVYDLSVKLAERGHDVSIYTTNVGLNGPLKENQKIKNDLLEIKYFNCFNNYLANNFKLHISSEMKKAIKNSLNDFDIVHLHEWRGIPNLYVSYYAKKYNIRYILQAHGSSPVKIEKQSLKRVLTKIPFDIIFGKKIFEDAFKIIAVSDFEKKMFVEMGIKNEKIEVIPNGIEYSEYCFLPSKNKFKKKYSIKNNEKIILYLGRIHKMKGIDILIETFEKIVKVHNNISLVIVGPDDGFRFDLEKKVEKLGIGDKVIFTGPLFHKYKREALVDADILIYPAKYEIFGLVPFEALMCNTPVIVSDGTGCSELISEAKCGYVFDYGNTKNLRDKILKLLFNNELSNEMSYNGKKYIYSNLRWDILTDKIESIYISSSN